MVFHLLLGLGGQKDKKILVFFFFSLFIITNKVRDFYDGKARTIIKTYKKEGRTCNDISKALNISNKQLYNRLLTLKNKGIILEKKYYSNGQITYKKPSSSAIIYNSFSDNSKNILSLHEETEMKMLVISDLHFGNKLERLDLVDNAFNYCVKNGINIILCAGDMIDSLSNRCKSEYNTIEKQLQHFVKDYPHDKNILTFLQLVVITISMLFIKNQNQLLIILIVIGMIS